ncbi:MAG: putative SprT family Zn-dependent metalloprotease [Rhodothermales bacterium]
MRPECESGCNHVLVRDQIVRPPVAEPMLLSDAETLATDLMRQHGLHRWGFRFDNARTRVGVCRYRERVIGLSRYYVRANDATEVRDTVLHEIAHALAGPAAGHGPAWRRIAKAIGCSSTRCSYATMGVDPKYSLWCDTCGKRLRNYHREPRRDFDSGRYRHAACGGRSFSVRPFQADVELEDVAAH